MPAIAQRFAARFLTRRRLWAGWVILIIIGTTWPWNGFQTTALWWRVTWIPAGIAPGVIAPALMRDMVINVLLYLPFGFWCRLPRARLGAWRAIFSALMLAAVLSATTETLQLFNVTRFPSFPDFLMNVGGAFVGAVLAEVDGRLWPSAASLCSDTRTSISPFVP